MIIWLISRLNPAIVNLNSEILGFRRSKTIKNTKTIRTSQIEGEANNEIDCAWGRDALRRDTVVQAMSGHEVAVSCLGSNGVQKSTVLSEMSANISAGMKQYNIQRIVYVASAGIHKEMPGMLWFNSWADFKKCVGRSSTCG